MVIKDKAFERRTEALILAFLFFRVGRRTKFKKSNQGCRTGWEKQPARMSQAQHIRIQEMQQVRMEGVGGGGGGEAAS